MYVVECVVYVVESVVCVVESVAFTFDQPSHMIVGQRCTHAHTLCVILDRIIGSRYS